MISNSADADDGARSPVSSERSTDGEGGLSASLRTAISSNQFGVVLAAVAAVGFVVVKASIAAFTHDEAYTFLHYVPRSVLDVLSFKDPTPNNHILNTLSMKVCVRVFGDREWSLRLPNVVSLAAYCWGVHRLTAQLRTRAVVVPTTVLLLANPFLLDFFALARGYGLAIAFVTLSAATYVSYLQSGRSRRYHFALGAALMAVLSNAATLYYALSLVLMHNIITLNESTKTSKSWGDVARWMARSNAATAIVFGIGLAVLYEPLRRLAGVHIDVGGDTGLWHDTVMSLVQSTAYGRGGLWLPSALRVAVVAGLVGVAAYWLTACVRSGWRVLDGREDVAFLSGAVVRFC